MNKPEFIAAVSDKAGLSRKDTERVINAALDTITCLLYTFRAHETKANLVCRLLLEKKKKKTKKKKKKNITKTSTSVT